MYRPRNSVNEIDDIGGRITSRWFFLEIQGVNPNLKVRLVLQNSKLFALSTMSACILLWGNNSRSHINGGHITWVILDNGSNAVHPLGVADTPYICARIHNQTHELFTIELTHLFDLERTFLLLGYVTHVIDQYFDYLRQIYQIINCHLSNLRAQQLRATWLGIHRKLCLSPGWCNIFGFHSDFNGQRSRAIMCSLRQWPTRLFWK